MYKEDIVQIVDVYSRYYQGNKQTMKIDPDGEAQSLSLLIKPLGRHDRKIAILAQDDERRLLAYQRAGYETYPMNGNRPTELRQFILKMESQIKQAPPKHMVLVSDDPEFVHLCNAVATLTNLAVWANSATVPRELTHPNYGWRPLEELLPNLKIARIDTRIDLENIFIGLVRRGWRPNLGELIKAIRLAIEDMGEIVKVTGYADFDELNRHHGSANVNWQREFTLAGGESRYVINQHGKNTADMLIADDIRTLVEHDSGNAGAVDVIALATMDRDFRPIVDTARMRGKKVVVLALEGGLSRELERGASEVRYLDKYLSLGQSTQSRLENPGSPEREDAAFMMRIAAWMNSNRWRFAYRDRLEQKFASTEAEAKKLEKLINDGWLTPSPNSSPDSQGKARSLEPNPNHAAAQTACVLARWIPSRVDYCLNRKGMPHVDSNFLVNGMARDTNLNQMNVGQTRADAENWLYAAETAGLVNAKKQPHAQKPGKSITTWWLPQEAVTRQAVTVEDTADKTEAAEPPSQAKSSNLRQILTQKLSESEITRLLFDYFRPVYREVEGEPKFARIQFLLDYVERGGLHDELMSAINEVNPAFDGKQLAV